MGEGISKAYDSNTKPAEGGFILNLPWLCNVRNGKPSETVIIFDWDDTLLCSSAINMQQWNAGQLQQLELTVETILTASMNLGETLIVTNGNKTWVQDSCHRFLPKLAPLLSKLRIMSARAVYEQRFPGAPFAWKKAAFHDILSECRGNSELSPTGVNLVVLGDSLAEIEAAQTTILRGPSLVKTVKFKEMPSVTELLGQLRAITQMLPELVNEESHQSKALVPRGLPPHLGYLTSWASGWRVTDHRTELALDMNSESLPLSPGGPEILEQQSPVTLAGG